MCKNTRVVGELLPSTVELIKRLRDKLEYRRSDLDKAFNFISDPFASLSEFQAKHIAGTNNETADYKSANSVQPTLTVMSPFIHCDGFYSQNEDIAGELSSLAEALSASLPEVSKRIESASKKWRKHFEIKDGIDEVQHFKRLCDAGLQMVIDLLAPVKLRNSFSNQCSDDSEVDKLAPQPTASTNDDGIQLEQTIFDTAWFTHKEIHGFFPSLSLKAVQCRLQRWRKNNPEGRGWKEVDDRKPREPAFLYQFGIVKGELYGER